MLKALLHPFGIMLLLASLVLAGLVLSVLDPWSGQAFWIVLLGLLAYAASIAVLHQTRPTQEQASGSEDPGPDPTEDQEPEPDSQGHYAFVQEALRRLDDTAALSRSQLISLLPRTLTHIGVASPPTALEKAQSLREALIAAIERLKPPGDAVGLASPPALQYHILHEAYVQRRPVAYILTRLSIAEATYFRNRKAAIDALTRHLLSREELIRTGRAEAAEIG